MADAVLYHYGLGRRKCAVARVRLVPGDGRVVVNNKTVAEYFGRPALEAVVRAPLAEADLPVAYNVIVKVVGGGHAGQAGAIRHGVARALVRMDEALRPVMRRNGLFEGATAGPDNIRADFRYPPACGSRGPSAP